MIPITKRLLACAALIPPGARVADVAPIGLGDISVHGLPRPDQGREQLLAEILSLL